jgi:hypothetical protein
MTQETFRTAYQQAHAELSDLQEQFERLRLKKEKIEKVVEALKPLIELYATGAVEDKAASDPSLYLIHESKDAVPEPVQRASQPSPEPVLEQVEYSATATSEPVEYAMESTSSDPFQRRIESVLWGWSQKREGMAPAV